MVRILSCHHFRGQRIGRCDEGVGVAVAKDAVIVALQHQINIYGRPEEHLGGSQERGGSSSPPPLPGPSSPPVIPILRSVDLGTSFVFTKSGSPPPIIKSTNNPDSSSVDLESDLKLSHSFATIDLIDKMSYNEKGKYILCLEKREAHANSTTNVRTYFHWQIDHGSRPIRIRIAGLVSPTGTEPEEESLMMVEIPLTSPATAVASCNLSGHIACLSAESIVNVFLFRQKVGTGRVRIHYYDFDRTYAIEIGFALHQIYFLSNYVACMNSQKVHIFRIKKEDSKPSPSPPSSVIQKNKPLDRVVFDPKNESIKVYLPSILRANRKRNHPNANICEDFQEDISSNHSKVVFCISHPGILVEDVLRVAISSNPGATGNTFKLKEIGMYPIRIKDHLGGIALMICTTKEGYLYHLPNRRHHSVIRVATYPFTAPLISFGFDSLFFHALTETGLESYTCRNLYHALKDTEGIKEFVNDCPLKDEPPSLIGIRPFVNVRKMICNSSNLCMLASSTTANSKNTTHTSEEQWTIYSLDLPDIDMVYEDIMRTAQLHAESNPEANFALLCEAYIALRLCMEANLELESLYASRYKEVCKLIGLACLNFSVSLSETSSSVQSAPSSLSEFSSTSTMIVASNVLDAWVDKGLTFLLMGRVGVQEIFSPENWTSLKEPNYIPGICRLIEVTFLKSRAKDISAENKKLSPTLVPLVLEFLANNAPHILVELVIETPFIRECNSRRLLNILQQLAFNKGYPAKESLAVLLTLVTIGNVDATVRKQITDILQQTNIDELGGILTKDLLLEVKGQQTLFTELAICIIASDYQIIVAKKIAEYLTSFEISVGLVMFAFAQAVNTNSDNDLQHCITKCLTNIVETYISDKLNTDDMSSVEFSDEDYRALYLLVRTYLSNINFSTQNIPKNTTTESHEKAKSTATPNPVEKLSPKPTERRRHSMDKTQLEVLKRNQLFGNVCTCVNYLLSVESPGGRLTPQSQNIATTEIFPNNDESRENFIKLLSILSNPNLANVEGVRDIIITYLYKHATQAKPTVNSILFFVLQVFAESLEKVINILLTKQPTTIMLFAKETFEKSPAKWKILVSCLKAKLQHSSSSANSNPEFEIYATILESVYLHLANSLTPSELEKVLEVNSEENIKFHGICKRVELANNYANKVINVSNGITSITMHKN